MYTVCFVKKKQNVFGLIMMPKSHSAMKIIHCHIAYLCHFVTTKICRNMAINLFKSNGLDFDLVIGIFFHQITKIVFIAQWDKVVALENEVLV